MLTLSPQCTDALVANLSVRADSFVIGIRGEVTVAAKLLSDFAPSLLVRKFIKVKVQ